jgi:hypothetical protein
MNYKIFFICICIIFLGVKNFAHADFFMGLQFGASGAYNQEETQPNKALALVGFKMGGNVNEKNLLFLNFDGFFEAGTVNSYFTIGFGSESYIYKKFFLGPKFGIAIFENSNTEVGINGGIICGHNFIISKSISILPQLKIDYLRFSSNIATYGVGVEIRFF